jgi:hypothetical protein
MEAQEIFDKVYKHLKKQGRPCNGQHGDRCLYIYGDMRCAVGALMTADQATLADLNGGGVYTLKSRGLLPDEVVDHVKLLSELQKAHDSEVPDGISWWEVVKLRLQTIAHDYRLSLPEPLE